MNLPSWLLTCRLRDSLRIVRTCVVLFVAVCFFLYPGVFTLSMALDPGVRVDGQPRALPVWFRTTARRYDRWATGYLGTRHAAQVDAHDVAATEWPMFGSVFFVLTAEELVAAGRLDPDGDVRQALDHAAEVIADPATATWVRRKWGDEYLEKEDVFYRMLLILGLSTYEKITGDRNYHDLTVEQADMLAGELLAADHHLADDYPNECYPNDVLWAAVAVQRGGSLEGRRYDDLSRELMRVLNGPVKTEHGLPAFRIDAVSLRQYQPARGCGNSGILNLAGELDPAIANDWYAAYVDNYWEDGWLKGFREMPRGEPDIADVDSGPVVLGVGSVASAFGIGAARAVGRHDHAAQLSMEALSASWPTPFGFLVPGVLGLVAADGWCFGELAMYFAMTRPNYSGRSVPHDGSVPPLVWLLGLGYLGAGFALASWQYLAWRRTGRGR